MYLVTRTEDNSAEFLFVDKSIYLVGIFSDKNAAEKAAKDEEGRVIEVPFTDTVLQRLPNPNYEPDFESWKKKRDSGHFQPFLGGTFVSL